MEKSILMSIQPRWVAEILNGKKTIEIRKLFPKDYVGWIFIYCTKGKPYLKQCEHYRVLSNTEIANKGYYLNGKVVAKFWCDKVEEIYPCKHFTNDCDYNYHYEAENIPYEKLLKYACLDNEELDNYLCAEYGYAIHITRLEILDKPMVLTMFRKVGFRKFLNDSKPNRMSLLETLKKYSITKAPQSWQYIED
ncbi:MAG: ASCH domain-containing protein [Methanobrevibacter sp.]|nr:ASCH domain-containing protein [Methanobrevibacter sp.]